MDEWGNDQRNTWVDYLPVWLVPALIIAVALAGVLGFVVR